jgi:hypothetical protein
MPAWVGLLGALLLTPGLPASASSTLTSDALAMPVDPTQIIHPETGETLLHALGEFQTARGIACGFSKACRRVYTGTGQVISAPTFYFACAETGKPEKKLVLKAESTLFDEDYAEARGMPQHQFRELKAVSEAPGMCLGWNP